MAGRKAKVRSKGRTKPRSVAKAATPRAQKGKSGPPRKGAGKPKTRAAAALRPRSTSGSILDRIQPEYLERGARLIGDPEVERVVRNVEAIRRKFHRGMALHYLEPRAELMTALVTDFWNGEYRDIPYRTISLIVFALSYVLESDDLLPDSLPVIGEVDDVIVVALCVRMVRDELERYREWKLGAPSPA